LESTGNITALFLARLYCAGSVFGSSYFRKLQGNCFRRQDLVSHLVLIALRRNKPAIHDALSVGKDFLSIVFCFELSCRNMACFGGNGDFRVEDVIVRLLS
jgi:hypothetical protein